MMPPDNLWAIEIKRSLAPKVERAFHNACQDLKPTQSFVVHPGFESFPLDKELSAISLPAIIKELGRLA